MEEGIRKALIELNQVMDLEIIYYRGGNNKTFKALCDMEFGMIRILAAFGVNVRLDLETMEYVAV